VQDLIRQCLDELQAGPILRAAIERLAGNDEMISFWNTFPPQWRGREGEIICQVVGALYEAMSLLPPLKQHQRERAEFLRRHAPINDPAILAEYRERFVGSTSAAMIAAQARMLSENLGEISSSSIGRQRWDEAWRGDPDVTLDRLISAVEAAAICCDQLDKENREASEARGPRKRPRKAGGKAARQVHFTRIMKDFFRREFGRPHNQIIGTLEQVAFDLSDGVDLSTIQKR
jgi:hypothetical protein